MPAPTRRLTAGRRAIGAARALIVAAVLAAAWGTPPHLGLAVAAQKGATSSKSAKPAKTPAKKPATGGSEAKAVPAAADAKPKEPEAHRRPLVEKPSADEVARIKAEGKKVAVIETAKGTIRFELFDDDAPLTVANFVKLSRAGFYDGLTFHRVVKEPKPFLIHGGDPLANGIGNPGYTIEGEFSPTRLHLDGTVAMARSQDPNSAGCQFYISLAPAPELDGRYAVFGQVQSGLDVVHAIVPGDVMTRVTIEPAKY